MRTKNILLSIDISTRPKRRKTTALIIELLEHIRAAELTFMDSVPFNLQNAEAFANAEYSIEIIDEAIAGLSDAY